MARSRRSTRKHRSRLTKDRRAHALGLTTTVGAFLAAAMAPLASAPSAHADILDGLLDPLIDPLAVWLAGVIDPLAGVDPSAGVDTAMAGVGAADVAGASTAGLDAAGLGSPADPLAALASPSDPAALFETLIYQPIHSDEQAWITSPLGEAVDNDINSLFGSDLIGNGAPGTAADPTGGAGGMLFGDGGAGYDSTVAGVAGGAGGVGGLFFDNGGAGGDGGPRRGRRGRRCGRVIGGRRRGRRGRRGRR